MVNFRAGPRSPFSHMNLSWFNTLMALVVRPTFLQVCLGRGQHNSMPTIIVVVLTGIGSTWKTLAFFWAPYQGYAARVGSCDGIRGQPSPRDKALLWPKPGMARAMCSLPFPTKTRENMPWTSGSTKGDPSRSLITKTGLPSWVFSSRSIGGCHFLLLLVYQGGSGGV